MECYCLPCTCMRPRYKRLVDNIFPNVPQEGLNKSNMEKLTFYSLSSPEKLDRIAEYLYQRASRDISRKRIGYVVMAMEAMDTLLIACHAQTLNLFVESFLRMIQKLLESTEPDLQILATQSFVKFANIEEDTPSYHRRYDFFVSKFSSMCHNANNNAEVRRQIRLAGIKGLQGVIRKTVADDLVENIWEPTHMDKILPSLLFNMQDNNYLSRRPKTTRYYQQDSATTEAEDSTDPASVADACIRELIGRASFGHIRSFLKPVLRHLDNHNLWVPNDFAVHTFRIIMFSIQNQYSYAVVEHLMYHLDENYSSSPPIRKSITDVLSKIISISAEESVGPSVLEIINSLLGHLKGATSRRHDSEELGYMESLIDCLGEFTSHLPDYQMVEIMVFIMSKVPLNPQLDVLLREMLLKCLLIVGRKYTNTLMSATFPSSLLSPLLRLNTDKQSVLLVQDIMQTLLDRQGNLEKLKEPTIPIPSLTVVQCSRGDTMFLRKNEDEIYTTLIERMAERDQSSEVICSVYTTLALFGVELLNIHTVAGYISMIFRIQEVSLKQVHMPIAQKANLHIVTIALLDLVVKVMNLKPLEQYVTSIVDQRQANAHYLLPPLHSKNGVKELALEPNLYADEVKLGDCLRESGIDVANISRVLTHRHSWVESSGVNLKGSLNDLNQFEVDSASSTPGLQRKHPSEELSFEAMKKVLNESAETLRAEMKKHERKSSFRTISFQDIITYHTVKDEDTLHSKLDVILSRIPSKDTPNPFEHLIATDLYPF
ncbi:protein EFR3 homolog cmp44E isoform X2 [Cimex lectularius]|uniref:Protein EFR3 homolog cmp44E n=1 Tax=Cimex lectularius TaxID=79782 RepID=A0A8I6RFG8_CIMLE|nr:protein EFR3 homolog cmp44E isoform X2 [Cimex lectularius]